MKGIVSKVTIALLAHYFNTTFRWFFSLHSEFARFFFGNPHYSNRSTIQYECVFQRAYNITGLWLLGFLIIFFQIAVDK